MKDLPARTKRVRKSVKLRTNGEKRVDAASTLRAPTSFQRILRPQTRFNWLLPNIGAITPQYIEAVLRGAMAGNHVQQYALFDLMLRTWPELLQCHNELVTGVMRKKMVFEPFTEEDEQPTPNAVERMKLCSTAIRGMIPDPRNDCYGLEGTIEDIMDGWIRGYSVLQIIWESVDDKQQGTIWAPKCTQWMDPTMYAFDGYNRVGLRADNKASYGIYPFSLTSNPSTPATTAGLQPGIIEAFPPNQFLVGIHKAKSGSPMTGALLVPLAWWWCAANFSSDWLMNLAQVFGLPFRWVNYDPNAPQSTFDSICNMLQNMGSNAWAAFPTGTTLEMISPSSTQGSDHSPQGELLDRADRYARALILGQTMTGTHGTTGKGGGQAFGLVERSVKEDRIDAAGKYCANVINHQLIDFILTLNYGDTDEAPSVRFLEDEEGGLPEAQRDKTLADAGLPIGVDFLRKKYGIPQPAEGEETIGGQPKPMFPGFGNRFGETPLQIPKPNETNQPPDTPTEPGDVQAKLQQILSIKDDALFARELSALAAAEVGHPFYGNQYVHVGDTIRLNPETGKVGGGVVVHPKQSVVVESMEPADGGGHVIRYRFTDKKGRPRIGYLNTKTDAGKFTIEHSPHANMIERQQEQTRADELMKEIQHGR